MKKLSQRAGGKTPRYSAEKPSVVAVGRRAKLRKRAIADQTTPPTYGGESKLASLVWTGMPGGVGKKAVARFGPKGFRLAKKGAESVGRYAKRVLKPIISKSKPK